MCLGASPLLFSAAALKWAPWSVASLSILRSQDPSALRDPNIG